jgi:4-amino-4-deoxy-L-arabinose transferase-like glycosyltransferase
MISSPDFSAAWRLFSRTSPQGEEARIPSESAASEGKGAERAEEKNAVSPSPEITARPSAPRPSPFSAPHARPETPPEVVPAADGGKPGAGERCFGILAYAAFFVLPLLLLAQFLVGLPFLIPWLLPQEAQFADGYELMNAAKQWLIPSADVPPGWFWFLLLIGKLPYVDGPAIYTAGALFAALLTLSASWLLARCVGFDRRAAFAAGLVLLSGLYFPVAAHRVGPEMLFAGLNTLTLACLYKGWSRECSPWLPLGGVCMAAAVLTQGLFGLALPLLGSIVFLLCRGRFHRLNRADGSLAFGLMLLLLLAWLGSAALFGGEQARLRELGARLAAPFLPPYLPPQDPVWFYALLLPAALLPWILALPFAAARRAPKDPQRTDVGHEERSGAAWIWIHLLLGFLLLSASSAKACTHVLPLLPLSALLLGRMLTRLTPAACRAFFLMLAWLLLLAALLLGLASLVQLLPALQEFMNFPHRDAFNALRGLPVLAGICAAAGLILWKALDRSSAGACLLACAVFAAGMSHVALTRISPSLQNIFTSETSAPHNPPAEERTNSPAPEPPAPAEPPQS